MTGEPMKTYDKDNLPVPVEEMALHRKKTPTPMVMVDGPFTVLTEEGPYHLPEGCVPTGRQAHAMPHQLHRLARLGRSHGQDARPSPVRRLREVRHLVAEDSGA